MVSMSMTMLKLTRVVVAGKGLPTKVEKSLSPWPLDQCLPFTPDVLAGYLARTYDVSLKAGFKEAESRMEAVIRSEARGEIGGDTQRIHSISTTYGALTFKHLLLPVWLLSYRYGADKIYQVVVNAATGEVQGERPYSWVKIASTILLVVAIGVGIAVLAR